MISCPNTADRRLETHSASPRRPSSVVLALAATVALLGLTGCPSSNNNDDSGGSTPTMPPNPTADFSFLAGNWSGTWKDTRYNVMGTVQASFQVSGNTVTANGVIGLQSLGLGNETGTGDGTVAGDTLSFNFSASTVGSGSGTLKLTSAANGDGSGSGSVTGTLNFGAFNFTGTANATTISGTFQFTSPTGGNGDVDLTKQ